MLGPVAIGSQSKRGALVVVVVVSRRRWATADPHQDARHLREPERTGDQAAGLLGGIAGAAPGDHLPGRRHELIGGLAASRTSDGR